jgi:hypothetical protein
MGRSFGGLVVAGLVAAALGACNDSSGDGGYAGGSSVDCSQYTTCGTCTPVAGCGWCFNATSGACTTDPDQCAYVSEFTWTWDPSGCPGVDAGVVPLDASAERTHD